MSSTHHPDEASTARLHERLLELWAAPIHNRAEALAAFAALYTDPLRINGTIVPLGGLVDRAAATHAALERTSVRILDVVESPNRLVLAFEMSARHVGTWRSALGDVAPAGRSVTVRTIDILTLTGGRISEIWVVSDEAALLTQLGARI